MAHEDDPTRRIPAAAPPPREPLRERAVVAETAVEPGWYARIEDTLRTLRTLATLALLLSLAALAVGVYALTKADNEDDTGASRERVAAIDDRVDRLEDRVGESEPSELEGRIEERATKGELEKVGQDVAELREAIEAQEGDDGSTEAVDAIGKRVDTLAQQVEDLRAAQDDAP